MNQMALSFDGLQTEDGNGKHDLLVFRLVELAHDIEKLPLPTRAAFATMLECEFQPIIETTMVAVQQQPDVLQSWADWARSAYPSHFPK